MSLIDPLLPYRWAAISIVVIGLASAVVFEYAKEQNAEARTATCRADLATEKGGREADRAIAAAAIASQSEAYRAEEQRRIAAQQKVVDDAQTQLTRARADAALADAASGRLQQRVAALVAAARQAARDPAATASGPPAADPIGMLADLQRRADERAGILARIADERGAAGQACERAYDALTATAP